MQNIRNFFISFGISLVVFLIIGIIVINSLNLSEPVGNPENSGEENVEVGNDNNSEIKEEEIIKGESFTSLLACNDSSTNRIDAFMLLHIDKENKQFVISSIPANMVLNVDNKEYYLGDIEREKGRAFLFNKIYALTGMKIDYHAFVSFDGFISVIDKLGGITFTVPENMYYKDVNGDVLVDIKKGTRRLTGVKALELMRYRGYGDGDTTRMEVQLDFMLTAFDTLLNVNNITRAPDVFKTLLSSVDTNFTADAFISNIDLIFRYKEFEKVEIEYPGVMHNNDDDTQRFIPEISDAIKEFKKYR